MTSGHACPFCLSAVSGGLFRLQGVGGAGFDVGGIHTGGGILSVDVERPVRAVGVVVQRHAVDGGDVQAVLSGVTSHDAQLQQSLAHRLLVGVDGEGDRRAFQLGDLHGEGGLALADHVAVSHHAVLRVEQIICEYFMEEQKNMGKITACLILLFTEISRAVGKADEKTIKQNNSKIQSEVIEYLKKHYRDATLNSVAKELCFHPNYLSSLLKAETNKGFKDLLFDIRMTEAANLLCRTDMKIDEIAAEIGYANEGYFYKCFKQRYGESPYNYRKKHRSS